jgi:hypothetical protein
MEGWKRKVNLAVEKPDPDKLVFKAWNGDFYND